MPIRRILIEGVQRVTKKAVGLAIKVRRKITIRIQDARLLVVKRLIVWQIGAWVGKVGIKRQREREGEFFEKFNKIIFGNKCKPINYCSIHF